MKRNHSMCSWRAGCGGTRTSGSEWRRRGNHRPKGRHRRLAADPASSGRPPVAVPAVEGFGVRRPPCHRPRSAGVAGPVGAGSSTPQSARPPRSRTAPRAACGSRDAWLAFPAPARPADRSPRRAAGRRAFRRAIGAYGHENVHQRDHFATAGRRDAARTFHAPARAVGKTG